MKLADKNEIKNVISDRLLKGEYTRNQLLELYRFLVSLGAVQKFGPDSWPEIRSETDGIQIYEGGVIDRPGKKERKW